MKVNISGPYSYRNISLFLFHSNEFQNNIDYLCFDRNVTSDLIKIKETQNITNLLISNNSDKCVYLQLGDLFEGGFQDRVLANDVFVPAKTVNFKVSTYCIEKTRWGAKEGYDPIYLSLSKHALAHNPIKNSLLKENSQDNVWANVDSIINKDKNFTLMQKSRTSYSNFLNTSSIFTERYNYLAEFRDLILDFNDSIGVGCALSGFPYSCDIYISQDIFGRLWDKTLDSLVTAAIDIGNENFTSTDINADKFINWFNQSKQLKPSEIKKIKPRTKIVKKENDTLDILCLETYDLDTNIKIRTNIFLK